MRGMVMPASVVTIAEVDLYTPPVRAPHAHGARSVPVGDLHGSAWLLLNYLVIEGFFTGIEPDDYRKFIEIYKKKPIAKITEADNQAFQAIVDKLVIDPNPPHMILLGDETFDRGERDDFIIKLMKKMGKHVDVILSNHGYEFLEQAAIGFSRAPGANGAILRDIKNFGRSYDNLYQLFNRNLSSVSREEMIRLTKEYYKPRLKIAAYILNPDDNSITICTHAPVGLARLKQMAQHLQVKWNDATAIDIARSINNMNAAFRYRVFNDKLYTLMEPADFSNPFFAMMWLRYGVKGYNEHAGFNGMHNGVNVKFFHGHDGAAQNANDLPFVPAGMENIIFNLDSVRGKQHGDEYNTKGAYRVGNVPHAVNYQPSPLFAAIEAGNNEEAQQLLQKGAVDPNELHVNGTPLLCQAIISANSVTVNALLAQGADIEQANRDGLKPYEFAKRFMQR
jgi:hypothetical protein